MAERSRCQSLSLGDRDDSFTAGLLEAPCLVKSGEQPAEQVAKLLPLAAGESGPQRHRTRLQGRRRLVRQARGGAAATGRGALDMRLLPMAYSKDLGTLRRAQAAPRCR